MRKPFLLSAGVFAAATLAFTYGEREGVTPTVAPIVEAGLVPLADVIRDPAESDPPAEASATAPRIALQAGHWLAAEAPDELAGIRTNGTRGGGKAEWEVTLEIARLAATMLEEAGYIVDVLPATVPQAYRADLFIAIHADGHNDTSISGFRVAAARRDRTGKAREFVEILADRYRTATNLRRIGEVTRRMENYYAFNSRRFRHSLHAETPGVIIETGFLTSPSDRRVIVDSPLRSAQGIAEAVKAYVALPIVEPTVVAEVP